MHLIHNMMTNKSVFLCFGGIMKEEWKENSVITGGAVRKGERRWHLNKTWLF